MWPFHCVVLRESADGFAGKNITAIVKTFDKRHSRSKYYVNAISFCVGI